MSRRHSGRSLMPWRRSSGPWFGLASDWMIGSKLGPEFLLGWPVVSLTLSRWYEVRTRRQRGGWHWLCARAIPLLMRPKRSAKTRSGSGSSRGIIGHSAIGGRLSRHNQPARTKVMAVARATFQGVHPDPHAVSPDDKVVVTAISGHKEAHHHCRGPTRGSRGTKPPGGGRRRPVMRSTSLHGQRCTRTDPSASLTNIGSALCQALVRMGSPLTCVPNAYGAATGRQSADPRDLAAMPWRRGQKPTSRR